MKKNKTTDKLKREYEKVYENPLNWCPLLGYIPFFEETNIIQNDDNYRTWDEYQCIIESARHYYLDICFKNMQNYVSVPDIILTLSDNPPCFHIPEKEVKAIRRLFQNLDYLILKTTYDTRAINLCKTIKTNTQGIPYKPVGRIKNSLKDDFSIIAGEMDIIRDVPREFRSKISFADLGKVNGNMNCARQSDINDFDVLLFEARKIAGAQAGLNHQKLFALLAILESWLVLTSLLFDPRQCEQLDTLYEIKKKLSYPKELLSCADAYEEKEKKQIDKKNKSDGGKHLKARGFQEAIKIAIKENKFTSAGALWNYFEKKHKGKKCSMKIDMKIDKYLIYYLPDKTGNNPDGCLYQLNIKTKITRRNKFSAFEKNVQIVKKEQK
ncbi:MAG: hypothetical protein WAW09_08505 [Smithella sp.]